MQCEVQGCVHTANPPCSTIGWSFQLCWCSMRMHWKWHWVSVCVCVRVCVCVCVCVCVKIKMADATKRALNLPSRT